MEQISLIPVPLPDWFVRVRGSVKPTQKAVPFGSTLKKAFKY
jgi:hypothetical protein